MHIKKVVSISVTSLIFVLAASQASAVPLGFSLNPSSPLVGYDLGGGTYAALIGIQADESIDGFTVSVADLNATITSGSVSAWYYAAGNPASGMFDNIVEFAPFVEDTVTVAGSVGAAYVDNVFDSLWAVTSSDAVVFQGTNTLGRNAVNFLDGNPFESVPEPSIIALLGIGILGLGLGRKRVQQ